MSDTRIVLWFAWFLASSWLRKLVMLLPLRTIRASNS